MAETARLAVFHGTGRPFEIREYPVPDPEPGAMLIKIALVRLEAHSHYLLCLLRRSDGDVADRDCFFRYHSSAWNAAAIVSRWGDHCRTFFSFGRVDTR